MKRWATVIAMAALCFGVTLHYDASKPAAWLALVVVQIYALIGAYHTDRYLSE